jgi:hypothetical protein
LTVVILWKGNRSGGHKFRDALDPRGQPQHLAATIDKACIRGDVKIALIQPGNHTVSVGCLGCLGRCSRICLIRAAHDPLLGVGDDVLRFDEIAHTKRLLVARGGSDFSCV